MDVREVQGCIRHTSFREQMQVIRGYMEADGTLS